MNLMQGSAFPRLVRCLGAACLGALASLALAPPANAQTSSPESDAPWRFAVHGGWWDVGFDATTPQGVLIGVGVPWVVYVVLNESERNDVVALDASAGYRFSLAPRTDLYAKLHTLWSYENATPCGGACEEQTHRLYFFPVAGLRQHLGGEEHRLSGPILGLDLALAVFALHKSEGEGEPNSGWHLKNIPFWAGPAFSQVYAGYEW